MIARDWVGEVAFVVGGGPSVITQPIERLRGRRVIAINSSFQRVPWADVLFAHDDRWWREYRNSVLAGFQGEIYTTWAVSHPRVKRLRNSRPPARLRKEPLALSTDPRSVPLRRTAVTAALNIAFLKGARAIVSLGLDGKFGPNGERNHYAVQYPAKWKHAPTSWERHQVDVAPLAKELADAGVTIINASPGSVWKLWPVMTLDEAIEATG